MVPEMYVTLCGHGLPGPANCQSHSRGVSGYSSLITFFCGIKFLSFSLCELTVEQGECQHCSNEGLRVACWHGVAEVRVTSRSLNVRLMT